MDESNKVILRRLMHVCCFYWTYHIRYSTSAYEFPRVTVCGAVQRETLRITSCSRLEVLSVSFCGCIVLRDGSIALVHCVYRCCSE